MGLLNISHRVLGKISTNVYFLTNKETGEGIVVDPADSPDYIARQFNLRNQRIVAILLTHGHFDHFYEAEALKALTGAPIYAYESEVKLLADPVWNRSSVWSEGRTLKPDKLVTDGQLLHLAGFDIKVIHTPGHTGGSCCYYFEEDQTLISGDTLFYECYGRVDLPTGSGAAIISSVQKLLELPPETKVYPGHGEETDIAHEREFNPALF